MSFTVQGQELSSWSITDEDGLPSMTVYEILQDDLGFIWMGTENGIVKYDGHTFKTFPNEKLRDNEILKTRKDKWNRIWFINLSGQLAYVKDDQIVPFFRDSILEGKRIIDLQISGDLMWLLYKDNALNKNVFLIYHLYTEPYPIFYQQILSSYKINNYSIRSEKNSLSFIRNNQDIYLTHYSIKADGELQQNNRLLKENETASSDQFSLDHTFTILNPESGFLKIMTIDNGRLVELAAFDQFIKITNLKIIDNTCWITSTTGLWTIPMTLRSKPSTPIKVLKNINANYITKDREGNYWITTTSQGVRILPSAAVHSMNSLEGSLPNNEVHRLYFDTLENRIISGHSDGKIVAHQVGKNPLILDLKTKGRVLDITKNHQEDFYCIIDGGFQVLDRKLKIKFAPQNLEGIKTTIEDSQHRSWVGGATNVKFTQDILTASKQEYKIALDKRTYAIQEDFLKNIWLGTSEGLYFFQDSLSPYLENHCHQKYYVTSITQTPDSILWVSTKVNGILGIKNKKTIFRYGIESGLASNQCKRIIGNDSLLWIATNKGVNYLNPKSMEIGLINKKDGLSSNEVYDILIAKEQVWVATPKGITYFPKDLTHKNKTPPPVHLTGLKIWEKDHPVDSSIYLKYHQNNLQFHFIGLGFKAKNAISYKYKMTGIDQDWIYTNSTSARYPVINPGNYRFEVYAINEDGVESLKTALVSIVIAIAWWQTWWLKLIIIVLSLGSIFIISQNHFRKKEEKRRIQDKISHLKQQALQAKMNPHFIFNVLTAIQNSFSTNQQEKAVVYLSNFSKLIRSIFDYSQKIEITLEKEIQFLNHYLSLEKLRFGDKVKIDLHIDPGLQEELTLIKIPPLLLQPLVENAFKHGLFHKEEKDGLLQLHFFRKKEWLQFIITDNGVGRKASQAINQSNWQNKIHHSSGISTIENRLQIVNQKKENPYHPVLHIEDLYQQGKATGTKITVSILLKLF